MPFDIGKRIAELRRGAGLSQDELAELSMLNRVTIARYESGRLEPGAHALKRIADALEVSTDVLCGNAEPDRDGERWIISEKLRSDPAFRMLFRQIKKAKPEHIRAASAMLKSLEGNEQDE